MPRDRRLPPFRDGIQGRSWILVALLSLAAAGCPHGQRPDAPPLTESEDGVVRVLLQAAEVEAARLDDEQRRRLLRVASEQKCPCPELAAEALSECVSPRPPQRCLRAPFAVRAILRGVVRKEPDDKLTARLLERFGPRDPERVELAGAPCRGDAGAPVTMVVFSDFECPFCAMGRELVELLEREAGPRLRVCFKHYPLTEIHARALSAAQAAAAAQRQGKFWAMHDRLFAHAKELEREDLVEHARAVGLDLGRFRADLDSSAVRIQVERDRAEAIRLSLGGTPTFLINGRVMTDPKTVPEFLDWIAEAIVLRRVAERSPGSRPATGPASAPRR
jgi:hypothetical protein